MQNSTLKLSLWFEIKSAVYERGFNTTLRDKSPKIPDKKRVVGSSPGSKNLGQVVVTWPRHENSERSVEKISLFSMLSNWCSFTNHSFGHAWNIAALNRAH